MRIDVTQTCRQPAHTGVQRVVRALHASLSGRGVPTEPVRHSSIHRAWVGLDASELRNLCWHPGSRPGNQRSARRPLLERLVPASLLRRIQHAEPVAVEAAGGFLEPEIFEASVGDALSGATGTARRVAIFYDALPLLHPQFAPPKLVARYPRYLDQLRAFDVVLALSEAARDDLLRFWEWLGGSHPPVLRLPLGVSLPDGPPGSRPSGSLRRVVSVGTLEPRKNQAALLTAAESLWAQGFRFELLLLGHPHRSTAGRSLMERISGLRQRGLPLVLDTHPDDVRIAQALRSAWCSVYPSLAEGYGLPIAESLAVGTPCVCSAAGAMGEIARGGGCLTVPEPTSESLAGALSEVLASEPLRERLAREARARSWPSWDDSAEAVLAAFQAAEPGLAIMR